MTAPTFAPTDRGAQLALIADDLTIIGADVPELFLAACRRDAMAHDGLVSVNRVRALLAAEDIEHHRYSAMWSHYTGRGRPMRKATTEDVAEPWEVCTGSGSGNDGRPYRLRVWIGAA